ncbi:MAG TPA: hypothetical protein VMH31_04495 [Methylomirabilota bacterium]|nr:hypothetical protein [Methylomirabilota bacterium]
MAAYSHYLNATVTVWYRLGDILLSASGVFVGDSGRSIFLEQHLELRGRRNYFRWEIPYGNIHSVETVSEAEPQSGVLDRQNAQRPLARAATASGGDARTSSAAILPLARPPKTA